MTFEKALQKARIDSDVVNKIMNVDYKHNMDNKYQDKANFFAAALTLCEELLSFEQITKVMFYKACCKSGYRLNNAKDLAYNHADKSLKEKLSLLGELKFMGRPNLDDDGYIVTEAVGRKGQKDMTCPCWNFNGYTPEDSVMPLSYCLCCAGHYKFHYQNALGVKLSVKEVVSSILNSNGTEPCVFLFEIESIK